MTSKELYKTWCYLMKVNPDKYLIKWNEYGFYDTYLLGYGYSRYSGHKYRRRTRVNPETLEKVD